MLLPSVPGAAIPGYFIPGDAYPASPGDTEVTLDTDQVITGIKTFAGAGADNIGGHWYGAVVTNDITILPNPNISTSASMFFDNNNGQVWEYFCNIYGAFGIYNKTASANRLYVDPGGFVSTTHCTLDDGGGDIIAGSGYRSAVTTQTGTYSIAGTDSVVLLNGSTSATLPSASGITGRVYTVKNIAAGAATVHTTASQTIDGATTYSLPSQYKYVTVVSDGANWFAIASN